jgi:hypothetical protein
MTSTTMTLDAFRATGAPCADLGVPTSDETLSGFPGRVYRGGLWVRERPAGGWPNGRAERWYLLLGNEDWLSDDLPRLEALLYEYGLAEELITV